MKRRELLAGLALLPGIGLAQTEGPAPLADDPTFASLVEEARARAAAPWSAPAIPAGVPAELPLALRRRVRAKPEHWRELGAGYLLSPLPPGGPPPAAVPVRLLRGDSAELVGFRPDMFDDPELVYPPELPADTGFGGIALLYPLDRPPVPDEFLRFGGASLVRGRCRDGVSGATARGVAVDTSSGRGEEFPAFVDYRIGQPTPDRALPVYALLDGPSLAGAYACLVRPGIETVVEVRAVLFLREADRQIGLAPVGGMFLHAPQDPAAEPELRPRIHSCSGLVVQRSDGETLFRALANPREPRLSVFRDESPRAFGLVQRIREAAAYGAPDLGLERSPDLLVEPLHDWGPGSVHLVEIPLEDPRFSNIVAFWQPESLPEPPGPLTAAWRLRWGFDTTAADGRARVRETRIGRARDGEGNPLLDVTGVEIVFDGLAANAVPPPEAEVTAGGGEIGRVSVGAAEPRGRLRVSFTVKPEAEGPVELRCALRQGRHILSEIWLGRLDAL